MPKSVNHDRNILIYADPLLPPSETFVLAQGEALTGFIPYYIGPKRLRHNTLKMPSDRTLAINQVRGQIGRIKEAPFRYFGLAPIYFRRLRALNPVLLHAHFGPGGLRALSIAEWLRIPLVTTFHGFDATITDSFALEEKFGHRQYVRRRHLLQQKGAVFIAVSEFLRKKVVEQGYPENRTQLHYIGVDTDFFRPEPDIRREPIILFVATLHEGKGCNYVIEAVAQVQRLLPEVELVIIGNGPCRVSLEQKAKEGLKRYRFLGIQPPELVRHWMNRSTIFSVGSVTAPSGWTEAFGLAYAEAQAMNLPVVSFASGGVPEAVEAGETGFLAPERDTNQLTQYMLVLLRNEALRQRMGEAGRERTVRRFDLRKQTRTLEGFYDALLRKSAHNAPAMTV